MTRSIPIRQFSGVDFQNESSDRKAFTLRKAQGVRLRPGGGFSRIPPYQRLWGLNPLSTYEGTLGLSSADKTAILQVQNEGHIFLVYYDTVNDKTLGVFYVGTCTDEGASITESPTLTTADPEITVLWRGLTADTLWRGKAITGRHFMGNAVDDNMVYIYNPPEIKLQGATIRPLAPVVNAVGPTTESPTNASAQEGNILFLALEPDMAPGSGDRAYERGNGNYVKVTIAQGDLDYFTSQTTGTGVLSDPYHYTVVTPATLPTETEVVNWIERDPNAQGIISARLVGSSATVAPFSDLSLAGGVTSLADSDLFLTEEVDLVLTYVKREPDGKFYESAPSRIVTCQDVVNNRVQISIERDQRFDAGYWDYIRIYVSDEVADAANNGQSAGGFIDDGYSAFQLALEVPNVTGSYVIAPSMKDVNNRLINEHLTDKWKTPPPCNSFVYAFRRGWFIGDPDNPSRCYYTGLQDNDETIQEGIGTRAWLDVPRDTAGDKAIALAEFRGFVAVFGEKRVHLIGSDIFTAGFTSSPITVAPLNSECVQTWTNGAMVFLGQDYNLYTMEAPRDVADSYRAPVTNLLSAKTNGYISQFASPTDTDTPTSIIDYKNGVWWMWVKSSTGGIIAFTYDFQNGELTGPIHYPGMVSVTRLSESDARIIGCDTAGNLFFMDLDQQLLEGETYTDLGALDPETTGAPVPAAYDPVSGYGVETKNALDYYRANKIVLLSNWINFGDTSAKKTISEIQMTTIQGSSGYVTLTITNNYGQSESREIGEVNGNTFHNALFYHSGESFQITLEVIAAEDKPFAVRDLEVFYDIHGRN